jgi:hypothetical protein
MTRRAHACQIWDAHRPRERCPGGHVAVPEVFMPENAVADLHMAEIALVVAPRTVAAHVEHILVELGTPTRTPAAVRAERAGLYVPCVPGRARGEAQ